MKKYETLFTVAKNVCDGVMDYYEAKNETEASKLYMFVWEQVYLLAQLASASIRFIETNAKFEASGKAFASVDSTVCKHSKEVLDSIDSMHESIHKAVETFLKKMKVGEVIVSSEYAEAKMIRYIQSLICGHLNNDAKSAEKNIYRYCPKEKTIVIEETINSDCDTDKIITYDAVLQDVSKEQDKKEEALTKQFVEELKEILYEYIENHPEDSAFIHVRYLDVFEKGEDIKKGKEIAENLHISGAAVSKKIAKFDAYFAGLLKKRTKGWR